MEAALFAALLVINNVLSHEGPPPPHSPPMVRELLAQPREAMDAETIFRNALPIALIELVNHPERAAPRPFIDLLAEYIVELSYLQKRFLAAVPPFDEAPLLRRLDEGLVSADQLLRAGAGVNALQLEIVKAEFILVTLRFSQSLRVATDFPDKALQFDSPIGLISLGTMGNDRHGPEAALIVDPGGDDTYERRPATGGAISVIFDLGGNDRYTGSDIAVRGLSAIVDFSGDDRYEMQGPGLAAAIGGVSLLVDYAGNDSYEARYFGQGAAAFGLGALIDMDGNDRYRLPGAPFVGTRPASRFPSHRIPMNLPSTAAAAFCFVVGTAVPVSAQDMIGLTFSGEIYALDSMTGGSTLIGAGVYGHTCMARDEAGALWTVSRTSLPPQQYFLTRLDPSSLQLQVIAPCQSLSALANAAIGQRHFVV